MPDMKVDLAIVGSGGAAFAAAIHATKLGRSVVMIERATLGGTCVNTGCVPSKALLATAEVRHVAGDAGRFPGIAASAADVDGVMALSREGRRENLAVVVRTAALERVLARVPTADASVRSVWRHLRWDEVTVPGGSTADVDTWEDAHRLELD